MKTEFKIKYKIFQETLQLLQKMDMQEFDEEFGDIEGQIELNFNGNTEGEVNDCIPFGDELLIEWYTCLNNIVNILKSNEYAAFEVPDTDGIWLEFIDSGNFLKVSEKKLYCDNVTDSIINKPLKDLKNYGWSDVVIDKNEFFASISKSTKDFLNDISKVNDGLLRTESISELIALYKANL